MSTLVLTPAQKRLIRNACHGRTVGFPATYSAYQPIKMVRSLETAGAIIPGTLELTEAARTV